MTEKINNGNFSNGSVNISEDVISVIANLAANEIEGVTKLSKGITAEITKMFGMKNTAKATNVTLEGTNVTVDIFIALEYGVKINEVCEKVQKNVKETIETMTGLDVIGVNINVQEVVFVKQEEVIEIEE